MPLASQHRARRRLLIAFPACLLAPLAPASGQPTDRPFVVATSTRGGGFALYGETLERVLGRQRGPIPVSARLTRGTAENLTLLRAAEVDAALIQGTAASELFLQPDATGLRVLFAMYPSPGMLATPTASPIHRLEDAVGRRVVFGVRASGLVTLGRQVFDGIGIDIDGDVKSLYVDEALESPSIVIAGGADALWGAGEGWPGFERLAQSPAGARFIGPADDQIPGIAAKYPLLKPMTVAAGAYPGLDRPLPTVGSVNLILARADLDERRAAQFIASMHAAEAEFAAALPQAGFSTLANTRSSVPPALLHRALSAWP